MKTAETIDRIIGILGWSIFFGLVLVSLLAFYLTYCAVGDSFKEMLTKDVPHYKHQSKSHKK